MLVELNTFGFVIETYNGIMEPHDFVVRTRVRGLKSPNSNFHCDDEKSSLHSFSLNATSKRQKDTTIFFFAQKWTKLIFSFFLIQPLFFAFYFKCLISCFFSSTTTYNLCFYF
jgi:hypothetical protein